MRNEDVYLIEHTAFRLVMAIDKMPTGFVQIEASIADETL
jgi:hypothetical protein